MKRLAFFLSIIVLANSGLLAETLNLEQARMLALANSRSLARYGLAIRSSILDERNHLYSMLPSFSAGYTVSMSYLNDWRFENPIDNFNAGATFSVTQIIFQGGRSFIQRAINSIATESIRKSALAEYFSVLDAVDNAYFAVLEAAATLNAEESALQTAVLSLSIAEIRHEYGMINPGDFLRALAEKESRENSRNQARRNLSLTTARFMTLTGLSQMPALENIDFSIYDDLIQRLAGISDEEADALYDEFLKIITAANPSLARAALNTQRAEMNLSLVRREHAPTISARVFSTAFNYSPSGGFNNTAAGGVSITGSIPIDFWVTANRVERSRIALESAALDFAYVGSSLETELQSALINAFAQAESVLSSRRSLQHTERHFEFVMERYRLLQSSVSDVSEAAFLLITSQNNLIRASYGFMQSLSRLRSLGALSDEQRLINILMGN